jgi:hypothetical protein
MQFKMRERSAALIKANLLFSIQIDELPWWKEFYYGEFDAVAKIARYLKRDNKFMVTRDKLKALAYKQFGYLIFSGKRR